ncbi:MAG: hypothetical protein J6D33_10710 [Turicibacter sp.]|nr:hypothetical protein [Turicibacter sp.]
MLNAVNMAELFKKANSYKIDSTEEVQLVGGERRLVPCLPQGKNVGVIVGVEDVTTDKTKYIQILVEFEQDGKTYTLKKNLFCSSYHKSEYFLTLTELLQTNNVTFDPRKPFNKNLLLGKVAEVEIGHKQFGNGEISEIIKIIREILPTVESMVI